MKFSAQCNFSAYLNLCKVAWLFDKLLELLVVFLMLFYCCCHPIVLWFKPLIALSSGLVDF